MTLTADKLTDEQLDLLIDRLRTRMGARAQPLRNLAGVEPHLTPAAGRVQVAPGQTIASASFGNPVWDHTVQHFLSAGDRDNQYPTAALHNGAVCFLDDSQTLWVVRSGVWVGVPMGLLAVATTAGPISRTASTFATAGEAPVTVSLPVVAGRTYRVRGWAGSGAATYSSGNGIFNLGLSRSGTQIGGTFNYQSNASGVGVAAIAEWTGPLPTGSYTFALRWWCGGGVTSVALDVNNLTGIWVTVEDLGGSGAVGLHREAVGKPAP